MENYIYNWHGEMMVSHRMDEVQRETEKIQLLLDAGLYNPGFFERMVTTIQNILVRLGLRIRKDYSERQRAYQVTTSKFAA
ncbi:MAG: hypothetical protein ACM3PS_01795 [Syntrophothermus sp.]